MGAFRWALKRQDNANFGPIPKRPSRSAKAPLAPPPSNPERQPRTAACQRKAQSYATVMGAWSLNRSNL